MIDIKKYINHCLTERNISQAELARRLGQTPQNFNQKMNSRTFNAIDLQEIANALGCDLVLRFVDRATGKPLF